MPYGDYQANYTYGRSAFGPFGGMFAGGMGSGNPVAGGMAGPGPQQDLMNLGGQIRPITYMAPARAYVAQGGEYIQGGGLGTNIGRAIGWTDVPRNISSQEYRMNAASIVGEKVGSGLVGAGIGAAGLAAGTAAAVPAAAMGSVVGAGAGALLGSLLGPAGTAVGGLVGSKLGGLAGGLLGFSGGSALGSSVGDLYSQQRDIKNFLETSTFRYVGSLLFILGICPRYYIRKGLTD